MEYILKSENGKSFWRETCKQGLASPNLVSQILVGSGRIWSMTK